MPKVEARGGKPLKKIDAAAPADKANLYQKEGWTIEAQFHAKTGMVIDLKFYGEPRDRIEDPNLSTILEWSKGFSSWKPRQGRPDLSRWDRQDGRAAAEYDHGSMGLHIWVEEVKGLNTRTK